ncbi:GerMN domain-containing protein [Peribacillus glennii]|uniref:GerMN domain-containing protein n=1 Tax=Peribacillus glennii TaxID=2303991 RepID=A0A372LIW8_9BACI|nr:GerMN domain-containing protein [Peribacillus glennii]RFU65576.1 hypothetical protein D0466_06770 [Peribacillus glennii]
MKRSRWNDGDIEELLRNLPDIKDKRNPGDIYQRIGLREGKERRRNWVPFLAAVSALFLLAVLASTYITGQKEMATKGENMEQKAADNDSQSEKAASVDEQDPSGSTASPEGEEKGMTDTQKETSELNNLQVNKGHSQEESKAEVNGKKSVILSAYSVVASDVKSPSVITVGVPDKQANYVVPVTYIAEEEIPGGSVGRLQKAMSVLDEESLGLTEYFPLDVKMTAGSDGRAINIDIPKGSELLLEDMLFFSVLQETFKYHGVEKLTFSANGKPGVEFSHMGPLKELTINQTDNKAYLIYRLDDSSPKLLVPSNTSYQSIDQALEAMKNGTEDPTILPSIPAGFAWESVEKEGSNVVIELSGATELKDNEEYLRALEAILFTAKNFGYGHVEFENAKVGTIGPYNLKKPLPVLVAPNRIN